MLIRFVLSTLAASCFAQAVVSLDANKISSGYLFLGPTASEQSHLISNDGKVVHSWPGLHEAGLAVKLLRDGTVLRSGVIHTSTFNDGRGKGGKVEKRAWNGDLLWSYVLPFENTLQHHDVEGMPNGNVLILAWERFSKEQAVAAGRREAIVPDGGIWSEAIYEVRPTGPESGEIVWEWHAWDHIVQDTDPAKPHYGSAADPRKINVNFTGGVPNPATNPDWLHLNSLNYNAKLDQILTGSRPWSEIWIIDHATTKEEAAGVKGDLLYRYGNPLSNRAGAAADQTLINQHDPQWIADGLPGAGNILVFNNGPSRGYSSADEIRPALDAQGKYVFNKAELIWSYAANAVTPTGGSAQRLPNGNTLLCVSNVNLVLEVTPEKETVYRLNLGAGDAGGYTFRANRFYPDSVELLGTPLAGPAIRLTHGATRRPGALAPGALGVLEAHEIKGPVRIVDSAGRSSEAVTARQSAGEVQFVVPSAAAPGPARFFVPGIETPRDFRLQPIAPGLFGINGKGEGAAAALAIVNGTPVPVAAYDETMKDFVQRPIPLIGDVYLSLFGTGISNSRSKPAVAIGGVAIPVAAETPLSEFPGVDQINIGPIPRTLAGRKNAPVVLEIDGVKSNGVQVSFE
ncbi:MAG: hypothetical protein FJW30_26725 [Acidobacteria bacterium]|nr:hypothetical protein [Acidobacteriota bacterium]